MKVVLFKCNINIDFNWIMYYAKLSMRGVFMNNYTIQGYLDDVLYSDLIVKEVPGNSISRIQQDIKNNMLSFLCHYDSIEFRKAFFVLVEEQSSFYEPFDVPLNIRSFVVTTVRNSIIEYLFSVNYHEMEMDNRMDESYVKVVLMHACEYFNKCDFSLLCSEAKQTCTNDFYGDLPKKYPLAYAALVKIGCKKNNPIRYTKVMPDTTFSFLPVQIGTDDKQFVSKIKNGISNEMDADDLIFLRHIELEEMACVYFDCFKMLSRNVDKVMKFLEFILQKDAVFVTSNYYITNGYIEKRLPILQAAHNFDEANRKFLNHDGLLQQHRSVLDSIQMNNFASTTGNFSMKI